MKYKASKIIKVEIKKLKTEKATGLKAAGNALIALDRKKYFTERIAKNI